MKQVRKPVLIFLDILCAVWEALEYLLLPAVFLVIGLWQQLPWQYFAITIGGYWGLLVMLQLALHLVFRMLGTKHTSRFVRKIEKIVDHFSRKTENPHREEN